MFKKKKLHLKKFYFNPILTFLLLTLGTVFLSAILSKLEMQGTYNTVNPITKEIEPVLVTVENLLNFNGIRYIISSTTKKFISFAPLITLIMSLIGIAIIESTGFLEALSRKVFRKIPKNILTFIIIFLGVISSLINEVGYAILIPLVALIYFINERNPILGVITAFCGTAFGYGVSIFIGTMDVSLMNYTENAALLIDETSHISLTSNLYFIVAASIIISIIGTIIIEKVIAPKIGKYKIEESSPTEKYQTITEADEQAYIERDKNEKKGLKYALISGLIIIFLFVWALIPKLPLSGMLLNMKEPTYLGQIFGKESYFKNSFTYIIFIFLLVTAIAYGIGAKTLKKDKLKQTTAFSNVGSIIILLFVMSQFIFVFKKTNIGLIITIWLTNLLKSLNFTGIPLIIMTALTIAIANLFFPNTAAKWKVLSPVVVPMFMQTNISPQFAQIVMRVGNSMSNGLTPLLASFSIYLAYLNYYNLNKAKPYTIKRSLKLILPYCLLISVSWLLLLVGWYIIGIPTGPGVYPKI